MMMQMYFATGGWNSENSFTFLWKWWTSDSYGVYALTLAASLFLGIMQEALASVNANEAARLYEVSKQVVSSQNEKLLGASAADGVTVTESDFLWARVRASVAHGVFIAWHFIA